MASEPVEAVELAESQVLRFHKRPIRAAVSEGTLWFAASDLCDALGYSEEALTLAAVSPKIPDCCRSFGRELPDSEVPGEPNRDLLLLSPLGVWHWTTVTNPWAGQHLANWAKKEMERLVPEVRLDDPRSYLAFQPGMWSLDWHFPKKFSGRRREFYVAKEAMETWRVDQLVAGLKPSAAQQRRI